MNKWVPFWNRNTSSKPVELQAESIDRKIVELFWLFVWKKHDRSEVASLLLEHYRGLGWKDLVVLDQSFRNNSFYYYSYELKGEDPNAVLGSGMPEEFRTIFLCLCTMAPNGFFREKALMALESFEDETILPFVLLRLNDWVEQVRTQAKRIVGKTIAAANAHLFVVNYGLVEKARRAERSVNLEVCERVDDLLRTTDEINYDYVRQTRIDAKSRNQIVMRVVLPRSTDKEALSRIYRIEHEPFIKLHVLKRLLELVEPATLDYYVDLLKTKSSQKCRMLIFDRISSFDFNSIETTVSELVFSTSASIRKASRDLIQANRETSFPEIYIESLRSNSRTEVSIAALSEVGSAADASELLRFLISDVPRLRKLGLVAIAKLSLAAIDSEILTYLKDDDASVSNAARSIQARNRIYVDPVPLEYAFQNATTNAVKLNCLRVLTSMSKWDAIYYVLKYRESSGEVNEICERQLERWNQEYNRSYTVPTIEQIHKIVDLVRTLPATRITNQVERVVFAAKGFEKKES